MTEQLSQEDPSKAQYSGLDFLNDEEEEIEQIPSAQAEALRDRVTALKDRTNQFLAESEAKYGMKAIGQSSYSDVANNLLAAAGSCAGAAVGGYGEAGSYTSGVICAERVDGYLNSLASDAEVAKGELYAQGGAFPVLRGMADEAYATRQTDSAIGYYVELLTKETANRQRPDSRTTAPTS